MVLWLVACAPPPPAGETVVFVVLDTVRADHTSLCGHDRPTTPILDALARRGAYSCDVYAPGSWTVPSHASYFTGRYPVEHQADVVRTEAPATVKPERVRPLGTTLPTLAEGFGARGWQTLLVSQNPALQASSGLTRGFASAQVAGDYGENSAWSLGQLDAGLSRTRREEPLFVFLNLAEAHGPYPEVPAGVSWLPATPAQDCSFSDETQICWRFVRGEASVKEGASWLRAYKDTYDWGVHRADTTLGAALARIEAARGSPARIVVTSDHGELMGEHGFVGHGLYLYEEVVRVPLVVVGAALPAGGPLSGLVVHDLVAEGRLPGTLPPVRSFTTPGERRNRLSHGKMPGVLAIAGWEGPAKTTLSAGRRERVDLTVDPHEVQPLVDAGAEDPLAPGLAAWSAVYVSDGDTPTGALTEHLRLLGYAE